MGKPAYEELEKSIKELKKAKRELFESNTELKVIFENAPILMILVDKDRKVLKANRSALKIADRSQDEIIGLRNGEALKCIHAFDDPAGCGYGIKCESCKVRNTVLDTFRTGKSFNQVEASVTLERVDGIANFIFLISTNLIEVSGKNMVLVSMEDITKRKEAEEGLKKSEERYSLAQKSANIGSWDWNILTGGLVWSDTIEPMFGFGKGKFGATFEAFMKCVHTKDRQFVIESVNDCFEKGEDYNINHRIVRPDGTVRWVSETGNVIRNENDESVRMLGIVQDITERKKTEDDLKKRVKELNGLLGLGKLTGRVESLGALFKIFLENVVPESMQFSDKVCAKIELNKERYSNIKGPCINALSAPIKVEGKKCGKLVIGYKENLPFIEEYEQKLVNGYAERIGRIVERTEAIDALKRANDELEKRVTQRTKELSEVNRMLKQEINEHKISEEELKSSHKQLRELSVYLQNIIEEERTRIAREIHDDLGQALTALKMDVSWLENKLPEDQELLFDKTASMDSLIDNTIHSLQRISAELRPGLLDDLGLSAAIEWQMEEFQKRSGLLSIYGSLFFIIRLFLLQIIVFRIINSKHLFFINL